ncbi:MAG: hypothetical protein IPK26_03080 [Planctomycetes bacterium]|nr:hypothetical protein [Planctomycetota bacterium]
MQPGPASLLVVWAFVGAISATAQAPSNWTSTALPANQTSAPNSIGTTVSFLTSNSVWLYSGITKAWTVLPVSNPTPIFQANDYCIVRDGTLIHAFASHTGQVETITTSGSATVVSGPASSSWVTLVADGNQAWGFGAFHGHWASLSLSQPNPTMVSNRLLGLLLDGSTAYALSTHHGGFVPVAADPAATLTVVGEGEVATANSPGVFRAFSAQQNNWSVQNVPVGASTLQQNEYALVWSGNQIWGCSGLTGTVATYVANQPIGSVLGAEGVAAFIDGTDVVCYGSGRGQFAVRPAPGATLHLDYHFALLIENGLLTPFSAITGTFGIPLSGTFSITSNDAIAWADAGGGTGHAYSPVLNTWIAAPPITIASFNTVRDAVVLGHAGGYTALSARHGTWVPKATTLVGAFQAPISGSTFLALDGSGETAHVFDARLNRWASVTGQSALTVRISRHTAMVHDNQVAHGFGQPSGEWYAQPLLTAPSRFDTASSIGAVVHGNEIAVYSVQGSFSYTGRYPEFTQAINLGNTLRLHQVAPPGSALFRLYGLLPAYMDLGPIFGRLYIEPSTAVSQFWPQLVGASGILDIDLPVPNQPALVGLQLHLQNLVVPPVPAQPWLSSSVAPILF